MAPETKKRKAASAPSQITKKKTKKVQQPAPAVIESEESEEIEVASPPPAEDVSASESEAQDDEEEEDQTEALLKGFESSDDEDQSGDEGFEKGQKVPAIPDDKKLRKKLKGAAKEKPEETGVVYVGRIPHGFYEHEMREYFSQFGSIHRLRLSRNRKTGKSKHYAFIEFESVDVARIVADTMNNYLMFGHILKCKIVPKEQIHESLWKGANKRFKRVPWNKLEGRKLKLAKSREQWDKRIAGEDKRRQSRAAKLKEIGYEFTAPQLKSIETVPKKEAQAIEASDETKLLEQPEPTIEESATVAEKKEPNKVVVAEVKQTKKGRKGKVADASVAAEEPAQEETKTEGPAKVKESKKQQKSEAKQDDKKETKRVKQQEPKGKASKKKKTAA